MCRLIWAQIEWSQRNCHCDSDMRRVKRMKIFSRIRHHIVFHYLERRFSHLNNFLLQTQSFSSVFKRFYFITLVMFQVDVVMEEKKPFATSYEKRVVRFLHKPRLKLRRKRFSVKMLNNILGCMIWYTNKLKWIAWRDFPFYRYTKVLSWNRT